MFVCVFAHPGRCHKKGGRAFAMGLGIGPILPPNLEIHTKETKKGTKKKSFKFCKNWQYIGMGQDQMPTSLSWTPTRLITVKGSSKSMTPKSL